MSRFTLFADVAGRLSLDASGGDRMTAAAVAVATADVDSVRGCLNGLPKWRDCRHDDAKRVVQLLRDRAASVSVVTMTKEPVAWQQFWLAAKPLQDAIVAQDRSSAGFVKPANAVLFAILGFAFALALGHGVKIARRSRLLDFLCREIIERTIVCDSDIQGDENISVFKSFWKHSDRHQPRTKGLGLSFVTRDVIVTTEQAEPLLLLPDYVAGIAHSAFIQDPGRLPLPVAHEPSKELLEELDRSGKLVVLLKPFDLRYEEMFGEELLVLAKRRAR